MAACAPAPRAVGPGSMAPDVTFSLEDGTRLTAHGPRGDVLVLVFFSIWCPASAKALQAVEHIRLDGGAGRLHVVAVNEGDAREDVTAFLAKHAVKASIAFDTGGAAATQMGLPTMPAVIVIDRSGLIRHVHAGYHGDEDRVAMGDAISALLADMNKASGEERAE